MSTLRQQPTLSGSFVDLTQPIAIQPHNTNLTLEVTLSSLNSGNASGGPDNILCACGETEFSASIALSAKAHRHFSIMHLPHPLRNYTKD